MNRDRIIAKLRERESELQSSGILHLALFGSAARGDDSGQSDVDLMADFDETKKLSLIGSVRLENQLTDILGVKADLADRKMLRPEVFERVRRESILVF